MPAHALPRRLATLDALTRRLGWLGLASLAALQPACSEPAEPATAIVVVVDADPGLAADTRTLIVRVFGVSGAGDAAVEVQREERSVPFGTGVGFPYSIGVTPLQGDPMRRYRIEVEARDALSAPLALGRISGGYLPDEVRQATLRLDDACRAVPCPDPSTTCRAGSCVSANVDVTTLPPYTP